MPAAVNKEYVLVAGCALHSVLRMAAWELEKVVEVVVCVHVCLDGGWVGGGIIIEANPHYTHTTPTTLGQTKLQPTAAHHSIAAQWVLWV